MEEAAFQDVLTRARAGEQRALTSLYSSYNRMLVRFMRAQAPGAGEDLAQETWMAIAPKLHEFRGDEREFRMWLLAFARKIVTQYRKTSGALPTTLLAPSALNTVVRHSIFADATVADAALAQMLSGLRAVHAEILLLRVVGGLSAEETAALVGKSAGAVRVIQHRALRQLSARLTDQNEQTPQRTPT